jgi:hypothetical protein
MAAIRPRRDDTTVSIGPGVRQRLAWLLVALASGWMAATLIAVALASTGVAAGWSVLVTVIVATAIAGAALYERFRRLGHIDESLVAVLLVVWATMLGLLSL